MLHHSSPAEGSLRDQTDRKSTSGKPELEAVLRQRRREEERGVDREGEVRSGMEAAIWSLSSFVLGADDPEDVWLNGVSVEDYVETARHKE